MNRNIIVLTVSLALMCSYETAFSASGALPRDFIQHVSKIYKIPPEFKFSAGGKKYKEKTYSLNYYPVIMIGANKRSFNDWLGQNSGNAASETNVYKKFLRFGFSPRELWLYQYTQEGKEMRNIEELTDGLKWFIYSVLSYTKSSKVGILAHGEGAVLAQATIKKYNLYNLIHAVVYIAGPFHGSPKYTYAKALTGSPVCANLTPGSDFLQELNLPDETPYNTMESESTGNSGIKYMTIYNGLPYGDSIFAESPDSPSLMGAVNYELTGLNHDGLRCSQDSSKLFIPFLSDKAIRYNVLNDKDKDGFMDVSAGGLDCDDDNPSIFPGAKEIPGDNIDQDCNDMDFLPIMGKDCLTPIKNTLNSDREISKD